MLMYRSNVLTFFVFESLFLVANLAGLSMGVKFAGGQLAGWNLDEVMFVALMFQVGHQVFSTFFLSGVFHIGYFVWSGRMDFVLLKPLHPLIGLTAATEFIISNIPNLFINIALFLWSGQRMLDAGHLLTWTSALTMMLFFVLGLIVRYGLALLVVTPAFYAEKLAEGEDAYWSLQSLAKYPLGVFPRKMAFIFNFILPLATMAAVPSAVFFGKQNFADTLPFLIAGVAFTFLALGFFQLSVSRYQSVNTGA